MKGETPYDSLENDNISLNKFIIDLLDALDEDDNEDEEQCSLCQGSCPLLSYNLMEDNFDIVKSNMFSYMDNDDNFVLLLRNITQEYKDKIERVDYLVAEIKKDLKVAASIGKESLSISLVTEELDVVSDLADAFIKIGITVEVLYPQGLKLSWM